VGNKATAVPSGFPNHFGEAMRASSFVSAKSSVLGGSFYRMAEGFAAHGRSELVATSVLSKAVGFSGHAN
jgi:hypothetical protein